MCCCQLVQALARLPIMIECLFQMRYVLVLLQLRHQGSERSLCISYKAEVNLGATSQLLTAKVDLHDRRVLREELLIRKACSKHQQHIAVHPGVIPTEETDKPPPPHI